MMRAAISALSNEIRSPLIIAPAGRVGADALPDVEWIVGGHPTPTPASEAAGRRALAVASALDDGEELLLLLSGGASALMAVPADGITLEDKQHTTSQLLAAGSDIHSLNSVRKHLSAIKGGQLAAAARGRCTTLAVSDVVGDDLSVVGSGPTVPDPSTFHDALAALERHGGAAAFPRPVVNRLRRGADGEVPETPKPGDPRFADALTALIGSRRDAMRGAAQEARDRGYSVAIIDDAVVGEARDTAGAWLTEVSKRVSCERPLCFISSGETTVRVAGSGKGGRNQEFALALVERLASLERPCALMSVGTDGVDGPTDAAGAIVDSSTLARSRAAGLGPPAAYLSDNNSHAFFDRLGDLVRTGPTGTNVGDLQVFLLA